MSLLYCVSSMFCFCICFILLLRGPVFLTESDEPKKESLQKEINGSATSEKVSKKSMPDVSILLNTQILDDRQVEVGPTKDREEFQEPNIEQVYTTDSLGNTLTWGDK
jgi:hypothetical protein